MIFHIKVDIIRGLDQKFENRKKRFWIFPFLTIFLTVAFKGLYRRHKMTTIWAFLSDMRPMCNDALRYRPWSSEELFKSIFMFLTFFMEYLTYSGQTAKSTWGEKSEKMAKKRVGNYYAHPGTVYLKQYCSTKFK